MSATVAVRRSRAHGGGGDALAPVLLAVVGALVLVPVATLLAHAVFDQSAPPGARVGFARLAAAFEQVPLATLAANSLAYAAGSAALALAVGTAIAWIVERTDAPGRSLALPLSVLPLVFPGILANLAWILLASPRIGALNQFARDVLGARGPWFDVYSMGGMIWVDGLHGAPIAFLMMSAAFRSLDPAYTESARVAGAGRVAVLRGIELPMLAPAWGQAGLLLFLHAIESLEAPSFLGVPAGIPVFTSAIVQAVKRDPGDLGPACALSIPLLAITLVALWLARRGGAGAERYAMAWPGLRRAPPVRLGRWRGPVGALMLAWLALTALLPFGALLWTSLRPFAGAPGAGGLAGLTLDGYRRLAGYPHLADAVVHSGALAAMAATAVCALAALVAWTSLRGRSRLARSLEVLASLSVGYPGVVLGVAFMLVALAAGGALYGTLWILLVAYVARFLPAGVRYGVAAIARVPVALEEAGRVAGAGRAPVLARITLPLAVPGLLAGWCYVAMVSFRELSASLLLYSPRSEVVGVVLFDLLEAGEYGTAAAVGVLVVSVLAAGLVVARGALGRWSASR